MKSLSEQTKMDLELKGLSFHTQHAYLGYIRRVGEHFNKPPEKLSDEEIKEYLHYMLTVKKASRSSVNVAYCAFKFFFETTCGRSWNTDKVLRTKSVKRLPIVLSKSEIKAILDSTANLKHKAMLMTTYAAGLRVSETASLKLSDIDSKNMQLRIDQGKGKKDRYSLLSEKNLNILRDYWKEYRPKFWLFPGSSPDKPITPRGIQAVFNNAKKTLGINKPATVHSLRHPYVKYTPKNNLGFFRKRQCGEEESGYFNPYNLSIAFLVINHTLPLFR
ncbi:tyrosine-type recombinase/integrase [Desulfitibacter alkalitolerans]|uniref:tyrosine-type recombinase/integrase n=1 Tax=Desulfitibacter alkalitolerans TaxID=264641 RepID=UPI000686E8D0|nr:site-specific integrase [Desulfitibacter alkalitolerans]